MATQKRERAEGGARATAHRGRIAAAKVTRSGAQNQAQRASGQCCPGGRLACGDDGNGGVNRGVPRRGNMRSSQPPVVSPERVGREVSIIKNGPVYIPDCAFKGAL